MNTNLATSITKAASPQTYYIIRILADRGRVENAYRAYAYFRWMDDVLDAEKEHILIRDKVLDRGAFLERQKSLLEKCIAGDIPEEINSEEKMLVELVQSNVRQNSGLRTYLLNMMRVMEFDVHRRGRLISHGELNDYTNWLAIAVTECLTYFVGNNAYAPRDEMRYLAVSAAHITHMLRDTYDDIRAGYFNVPSEVLGTNHIGVRDVHSPAYRAWVRSRVQLAREYFEAGKEYFRWVKNTRLRLAVYTYIARFERVLDSIEKDGYQIRPAYSEQKRIRAGLRLGWSLTGAMISGQGGRTVTQPVISKRQGRL